MEFAGSFFDLLRPYPILVGVFAISVFAMHASIYLYLKTDGELRVRIHGWMWKSFAIFLVLYIVTTVVTLTTTPTATANFEQHPWVWAVVVLNVLAIANIPRAIYQHRAGYAFFSSSCSIAAFVFLFGVALYPNLITSSLNPEWSLTIYNAASSEKTLKIMRLIAFMGMPFVLAYTSIIYWVFRGKVELGQFSY
jgi:cytochrome d ubiquinol oxidase subunit II